MVKIRQSRSPGSALRKTRFVNQRLSAIGVELLTLSELRERASIDVLLKTERVEFYMLLVVTQGKGIHLVDFKHFPLQIGQTVFVRPGQIQKWQPESGLEADVLLIDPSAIQPTLGQFQPATMALLRLEEWSNYFTLRREELEAWNSLVPLLWRELNSPELDLLSAVVARELLLCLLLCISRAATRCARTMTERSKLIHLLHRELDGFAGVRPSVALLAKRLNVSTSTLTRVCKDELGHSAKEEVDRRILLDAQRLLVHSTATCASIGEQLGFSEPTNFAKFFRRLAGMTPEAFRRRSKLAPVPVDLMLSAEL